VLVALVVLVGAISYQRTYDDKIYLGGDNVVYYLLGTALSDGAGYTNIWSPKSNSHNHFPPGYPAAIAGVLSLFDGIGAVKMTNGLFFLVSLALLFLLFRRFGVGDGMATVGALAVALNAHLLRYATIMMSEIMFFLLSVVVLYCVTREREEVPLYRDGWFGGMVVTLTAAYYTRSIGLALVFGVLAYYLLRWRWKRLVGTVAGFVVLALPWQLYQRTHGGSDYIQQLFAVNPYRPEKGMVSAGDMVARFWSNLSRYVSTEIPMGCFPILEGSLRDAPTLGWSIGLVLVVFIAYGIWQLPRYQLLVTGYLAGTFGITLLWPDVWYGVRFIVGIIPLLVFLALWGLLTVLRLGAERIGMTRSVRAAYLLPLLLVFLPPIQREHRKAEAGFPRNWLNYFRVAGWAAQNTPEGAVVSSRKPAMFYLYSKRPSVRYAYAQKHQKVIDDLARQKVDYVVIDQLGFSSTPRYLVPAVQAFPRRFSVVTKTARPQTYMLRFNRKGLAAK
jgi:hypothetical protein